MRAFAVRAFGDRPALIDLPLPDATDGYLVRITCAAVNPIDYKRLAMVTAAAPFPLVLGFDFAGIVEAAPAGDRHFAVGDRVFGTARSHGSFADYSVILPGPSADLIARIPDGMAFETAAALPVSGLAALGSLSLLGLRHGQTVAVLGVAGAVGGYAVQLARAAGLHVIATVRGDTETARALGADEIYDAGSDDWMQALRRAHPGGIDGVIDLVSDANGIAKSADLLRQGGSLVSSLLAADPDWFRERRLTAHNLTGQANPQSSVQGLDTLAAAVMAGSVTPRIALRTDLDHIGDAIFSIRQGGLRGKAIVRISDDI